jgi:hypothetical protein
VRQPAQDNGERGLKVAILIHVDPQRQGAATLLLGERDALPSTLRSIAREREHKQLLCIAFNLEQSQVIFEQDDIKQIDFSALERAIAWLSLGTVTLDQLAIKNAGTDFFVALASEQVARNRANGKIFLGPNIERTRLNDEMLGRLGEAGCPVFYLRYTSARPFNRRDNLIASAVQCWRGL